jgi:hypothetical protein
LTWATVRATPEQITQWRKSPAPQPTVPLPASQLKHSEEQSIVALWAVCEAIAGLEDRPTNFNQWSVIAAPRFCGRLANANSLERYRQEGAWGISPHMIPQHSLHAVSGTISQLLKFHGPNFGVGNGLSSACDGWLVAATLLTENMVPGVWLILTGHVDEYLPAGPNHPGQHSSCEAVALALTAGKGVLSGMHVRVVAEETLVDPDGPFLCSMPEFSLGALVDELRRTDTPPAAMWRLPGVGWVEVEMR